MAYTDDAVKAKLSALNETQEGIVTVAQWIMFHRYRGLRYPVKYAVLTDADDMQTRRQTSGCRD